MNRPWHRWLAFAACLAVLLGALGWMTVTLLRFEHAQNELQRQAQLEERVRLALWRMDSALTALVVEESSRPASAYQPAPAGAPATPSVLQGISAIGIRLHFQRGPDGAVTGFQLTNIDYTPEFEQSVEAKVIAQQRAIIVDAGS